MPTTFGHYAVDEQDGAPESTLELYRAALRMRRILQTGENLTWHDGSDQVAWFSRDNGWNSFTNFGQSPVALPAGEFLLSSAPSSVGKVPGETTVWFRS
jgi:alpha-glucosidase